MMFRRTTLQTCKLAATARAQISNRFVCPHQDIACLAESGFVPILVFIAWVFACLLQEVKWLKQFSAAKVEQQTAVESMQQAMQGNCSNRVIIFHLLSLDQLDVYPVINANITTAV